MSLDPILWALKDAPVADSLERLVLVTLGERAARADGCTAFPSRDTLAATVLADPKTVQRVLQRLVKRGLIAKGDQSAARYIRADRRPVVYDLLIPYSWFPNPERMNAERRQAGLPPLTPEDRPDIAPPPARARRSDVGRPRKKKAAEERGDCQTPRDRTDGGADNPARGDCQSQRGDSESRTGGLSDPRTSSLIRPLIHPEEPLSPPSVPTQRPEPEPATSERENLSPFKDLQQSAPLPGVDVYAAQLADADAVTRVTTSWAEAYKRSSSGSEPSARAVSRVRASATSRLRAGKTADDLVLIAADMAETNLAWTDLAEHEAHWLHKQHGGLTGTDADKPSVTDQRVQAALDLGRQMQAEANARHSSGYDAARTYMKQQAAIGARPYGWEQVPHCGHLDCDEITRYRQTEDADGLRSLSACPNCHPSLRF